PAHIPIWIGGNSPLSPRRGAAPRDGGEPFPASAGLAHTARTIPLEGLGDLAPLLDHLWEQGAAARRARDGSGVGFSSRLRGPAESGFDPDAHLQALERMAAIGVTWSGTTIPGTSLKDAIEAIERYGNEVIRIGS